MPEQPNITLSGIEEPKLMPPRTKSERGRHKNNKVKAISIAVAATALLRLVSSHMPFDQNDTNDVDPVSVDWDSEQNHPIAIEGLELSQIVDVEPGVFVIDPSKVNVRTSPAVVGNNTDTGPKNNIADTDGNIYALNVRIVAGENPVTGKWIVVYDNDGIPYYINHEAYDGNANPETIQVKIDQITAAGVSGREEQTGELTSIGPVIGQDQAQRVQARLDRESDRALQELLSKPNPYENVQFEGIDMQNDIITILDHHIQINPSEYTLYTKPSGEPSDIVADGINNKIITLLQPVIINVGKGEYVGFVDDNGVVFYIRAYQLEAKGIDINGDNKIPVRFTDTTPTGLHGQDQNGNEWTFGISFGDVGPNS